MEKKKFYTLYVMIFLWLLALNTQVWSQQISNEVKYKSEQT